MFIQNNFLLYGMSSESKLLLDMHNSFQATFLLFYFHFIINSKCAQPWAN